MRARPWDALWLDVHVASMVEGVGAYGELREAAVAVAAGRVAWVGEAAALPDAPERLAARVHRCGGAWLTPGLVDCHTHLVFAGDRADEHEARLGGRSYAEIAQAGGGIASTVRATRGASFDELLAGARGRMRDLVADGVTTVEVKSGYGLDLETELRMLRVARALGSDGHAHVIATCLGAHAVPPEHVDAPDRWIDVVCDELLPVAARDRLADAVDAYHEHIAFDSNQVSRVFRRASELGLPVRLHADQLSDMGGAALAAQHGALSADHLEHTSADGARAMAASGTVAVLLPGAFYTLRETSRPPIDELRAHGVPLAVASDCNPGTSPVRSMLPMLSMACTLLGFRPDEALTGATRNAARALGLGADRGTVEVGKRADFALWSVGHPRELCYWLGGAPCAGTVVDGVPKHHGAGRSMVSDHG